jgi:hypothetical protein
LIYKCYNPAGSTFVREVAGIQWDKQVATVLAIRIRDDLLQIVLNKRLDRPVNLKARAYSDEYIVDVKGNKIFSPGPDGKANTKDDISLPINPEVLGWSD